MGCHRVGIGPSGGVGFRVVFSGRDSCSVPRIGCLRVSCPCSSVAVGSGPVGSAICVDAGISGRRKSIPTRIDHERRARSASHSCCPVWRIPWPEGGMRRSNSTWFLPLSNPAISKGCRRVSLIDRPLSDSARIPVARQSNKHNAGLPDSRLVLPPLPDYPCRRS